MVTNRTYQSQSQLDRTFHHARCICLQWFLLDRAHNILRDEHALHGGRSAHLWTRSIDNVTQSKDVRGGRILQLHGLLNQHGAGRRYGQRRDSLDQVCTWRLSRAFYLQHKLVEGLDQV